MITQQQKGNKKTDTIKSGARTISRVKKISATDGSDMIVDPELNRFSGEEFLPEKHKIAENRLANSALPWSSPLK